MGVQGDGSTRCGVVRWAYESFGLEQQITIESVGDAWQQASKDDRLPSLYRPDGVHPPPRILSRGRALPCISEQGESRGCRRDHPRECCSFRLRDRQPANQCGACRHRAGIRIAPAKDRVEDKAIRCRHHRTQTDSAYVAGSFNRRPLGYRKFEGRMGRTEFGLSVSSHDAPYKLQKPLSVKAIVDFGGTPDMLTFADRAPRLTPRTLTFVVPRGPNSGRVRYKAELDGMHLIGIGEIIVDSAQFSAIGEWSVTRRTPTAPCAA